MERILVAYQGSEADADQPATGTRGLQGPQALALTDQQMLGLQAFHWVLSQVC